METKGFIAEHRKLIPILTSGSKAVRLKEAKKQHKELLEYMKKNKIKEKSEKGHGKKHEKKESKSKEKKEHRKR